MFSNMTRKLLLENSNQFISDRLILGEIIRLLKTEETKENLLDIPASHLKVEYMTVVKDDLKLNELGTAKSNYIFQDLNSSNK